MIRLSEVVGKGYNDFWNFRGRYRVVKGSRASKKSKTTALWFIVNLIKYPESNLLCIRKTAASLMTSQYTELKWACKRLGVEKWFMFTRSPLECTYLKTGQKIYFRGLDDPLKITSITVAKGTLCWMWIEEAYEIMDENKFDTLDESIRGEVSDGLFKQITLTFNPWNARHWIKSRFFDSNDPDILAMTTNYLCNEWLDDADRRLFEDMKLRNPRRYSVAGLGEWGVVDGLIYENWTETEYTIAAIKNCKTVCGLDFGYTNDPTAFFIGFLDVSQKKLYVWDEFYEKGLSNRKIYDRICKLGYSKENITADCAEPKSIDELRGLGLRIRGAKKGRDSVNNGIQWLQDLQIIIHPRCNNFLTEISNYTWRDDKFGNKLNSPIDYFNHLMDAMRYGCEQYMTKCKWVY